MEKIVIANHKMYLKNEDVVNYVNIINNLSFNVNLYIAPSNIYLSKFKSNKYHLTAQDVSIYLDGSHTGEISSKELREIGVDSVIIGHNERRIGFNENSEIINKKIKNALKNNLKVILCINENDTINELKRDLKNINYNDFIIAYEPTYSVGTGKAEEIEKIKEKIAEIKNNFDLKVIYGGSVNKENISNIVKICDGVIIGKMSLNVKYFTELLNLF